MSRDLLKNGGELGESVGKSVASPTSVDQMVSVLSRESRFFTGIQSVTDVLEQLNCFLEGADAASVEEMMSKSVESWLEQTKETKGVIGISKENCVIELALILQERRLVDFLGRATQRFSTLSTSRSLALDVQSSKALTVDVKVSGPTHNLTVTDREANSGTSFFERYNPTLACSLIEEFVDSAASDLTVRLKEGATKRSVISLVGPERIGKTFLARKVYNSKMIRDHFDCYAWISVSGLYDKKELLLVMIKRIIPAEKYDVARLDMMQMMELIGTLRQFLESKRYMLVFDDVCHEEFWHFIKYSLPDNDKGSRIIITTHSDAVVASCKEGSFDYVHKLEPLSEAMSWELFRRIAFQNEPEQRCPLELEKLSLELIRMCKSFPLPTVAIAGLLSTKDKTVLEWKKQHDHLTLELKSNLHAPGALEVLASNLLDLPNPLRSCFLCFSIFPKETLVPNDKLFKLWIAEGFVEKKRGKTLEQVAEEYLHELINRNLVQACEGFYGPEQFCRVRSLIHDIVRVKAHGLNFCCVWDDNNSTIERESRRISICNNIDNALEAMEGSHVSSIFFFNITTLSSSFLFSLFREYKDLTSLDLDHVPIQHLPEEVGNLAELKYLSLKNTKLRQFPIGVHKLLKLQTLDLRNTAVTDLPILINNLKELRHLLAGLCDNKISGDSTRGVRMKEGFGCLKNLRTLMTVEAHHIGIGLAEEVQKLQELRRLGISKLTTEVSRALYTFICEFSCLEYLSLQSMNKYEILDLRSISSPPPLLRDLILKGPLVKIPDWISHLQNLSMLCLSFSRLTDNPVKHISHLPNLVSLWMYQAFEGKKLHFKRDGFQRLKLLVLSKLEGLNAVEIEEGALPLLEELRIGPAPVMNQVPFGIQHLQNLKVLSNFDMSNEFVLWMQPVGGSDYWKVQHIPSVLFWYKVQERNYKLFKLGDSDLLKHLQGLPANTNVIAQVQRDFQLSFCHSDDEVSQLSISGGPSIAQQNSLSQWSFSSGLYTDDVEE